MARHSSFENPYLFKLTRRCRHRNPISFSANESLRGIPPTSFKQNGLCLATFFE